MLLIAVIWRSSIKKFPGCVLQKSCPKKFAKFTEKHMCWSFFFEKNANRSTILLKTMNGEFSKFFRTAF